MHSVDFIFHVIHATRDDIYQFVSITEYVHFILICDDKVVDSVCALSRSSRSYSAQLQMYFRCKTRLYLIALNESSMRINEQFCEFQLKQNTHAYFAVFFTRIDAHSKLPQSRQMRNTICDPKEQQQLPMFILHSWFICFI